MVCGGYGGLGGCLIAQAGEGFGDKNPELSRQGSVLVSDSLGSSDTGRGNLVRVGDNQFEGLGRLHLKAHEGEGAGVEKPRN